ncbi:MAG: histidinol-phosphate transaminase [Ruminococcaceae bacterium]|nr:histidinol-phosphate transaminase [Oscillospiraceae bacterium]
MTIQAKKSLAQAPAYSPGRPIDEIKRQYNLEQVTKLASNENPLGASPLAQEAVRNAAEDIFLYPDPDGYALRHALASHIGLPPNQFIFGTGSDGLIELICKTFLSEGDESVMPHPSFSLYELNVLAAGAMPRKVLLRNNQGYKPVDLLAAITPKTKVVWLCNPNNPTGGMYTEQEQLAFLEALDEHILVVIDEAYYEYACHLPTFPKSLALLQSRKNIIILRTFSKIYGLAGLRVGYAMADPALIAELEKARPPFNVCAPAQKAAIAALTDKAFVEKSLALNNAGRVYLETEFSRMGLSYIPSATNFIAVDTGHDSKMVYERLLAAGYIVKGGHVLDLPGYLRVTIGTPEQCAGFIRALSKVLQDLSE